MSTVRTLYINLSIDSIGKIQDAFSDVTIGARSELRGAKRGCPFSLFVVPRKGMNTDLEIVRHRGIVQVNIVGRLDLFTLPESVKGGIRCKSIPLRMLFELFSFAPSLRLTPEPK